MISPSLKNQHYFLQHPPYDSFGGFIDPQADRFDVLRTILTTLKLPFSMVTIAGNRHFFTGSISKYISNKETQSAIVMTAHYDCVKGSAGANDNGAAVFMLLEAAIKLAKQNDTPWLIIFTDKEELLYGQSIKAQGSYSLAMGLREAGLRDALFFNFDACGRGDTLIISTTCDYLLKKEDGEHSAKTKKQLQILRSAALDAAEKTQSAQYLLMPTPFSDDLGFLRAGLAAQTITVLPYKEAAAFASQTRGNPAYIDALLSREQQERQTHILMPQTWRYMNSPRDKADKLNPEHFYMVVKFILCLLRIA